MSVQPVAYQPYQGLFYMALHNAAGIVRQAVAGLVDMDGNALDIPVRAEQVGKAAEYSEITLGLDIGRFGFGLGKNALARDETTGVTTYGFEVRDCTLRLGIKARSQAERFYLVDALVSLLVASYTPSPAPGGYVEGSLLDHFLQAGFVVGAGGPVEMPEPQLGEARPESLVFPATLPLECNLWVAWTDAPAAPTWPITIQQSLWNPGGLQLTETIVVD